MKPMTFLSQISEQLRLLRVVNAAANSKRQPSETHCPHCKTPLGPMTLKEHLTHCCPKGYMGPFGFVKLREKKNND